MGFGKLLGSLLFLLLVSWASSSSISDGVFQSHGFTGRSLLQSQKSCSVDFENQNYTIITSQCKGPEYPPAVCCNSFKEFACPFYQELNDLSSNCANTMFSYINLNGHYPSGLFANMCKEGKDGLDCSNITTVTSRLSNSSVSTHVLSPVALLSSLILGLLLCLM